MLLSLSLSFSLRLEENLFISVLSFAISGERYQLCSRIQGEETHCREQILLCRRYQRDFQLAYPIGLFRSPRFFNQHPHRAEDGPLLFQLSEVERVFQRRGEGEDKYSSSFETFSLSNIDSVTGEN